MDGFWWGVVCGVCTTIAVEFVAAYLLAAFAVWLTDDDDTGIGGSGG